VVLALLVAFQVGHQLSLFGWYIEDAAISFSYARNLAWGEGSVTYPGGERVEGYSNPTWTLLMIFWEWVGVDGFASSKIMGWLFGAAAVPIAYLLVAEARGNRQDDDLPLVGAAAMAVSAQHAIWSTSGLENSIFNFFQALGMLLALREARLGGAPWSALAWLGLSLSRPEGVLYAAWAGFAAMVVALARDPRQGAIRTAQWLGLFFVPFGIYHAFHLWYFAWPFPNTYYAKLGSKEFKPWGWSVGGWKYVRDWSQAVWQGWFLPVYLVALPGLKGRRALLSVALVVATALLLAFPGPDLVNKLGFWPKPALPSWFDQARVLGLLAVALLAGVGTLGRPGAYARALSLGLFVVGTFFAVYSSGDWMKGFRWFSLNAIPMVVLFTVGVGELAELVAAALPRAKRWPLWAACAGLLVAFTVPNLQHTWSIAKKPETGPFGVRKRVNYYRYMMRRLHLERPTVLDVDMGAHMFWGEWDIVDIAGLVDPSMGHHWFEDPFVKEYFFQERLPELTHLHASWENKSRLSRHPEWDLNYVEIPGYPVGKNSLHVGNWVRRDLIVSKSWRGQPGRRVAFTDGLALEGVDFPAEKVPPGGTLYVEIGLSTRPRVEGEGFGVMLFLSDASGVRTSHWLPPGYDWLEPWQWKEGEQFFGRFSLPLPEDLPLGRYEVGVVLLDDTGAVAVPEGELPSGALADAPRFAQGEVRFAGLVEVVDAAAWASWRDGLREEVVSLAHADRCEEAAVAWERVRAAATRRFEWLAAARAEVGTPIAACVTRQAAAEADLYTKAEILARARRWDHWEPTTRAAAREVAVALEAEGAAAWERAEALEAEARAARALAETFVEGEPGAGIAKTEAIAQAEKAEKAALAEWEIAFQRYNLAVKADTTRAWARRYAEESRDKRHKIDKASKAQEAALRKKRADDARIRHQKAVEERKKRLKDPAAAPTVPLP
jgi:hypothetical protein